MRSLIIEETPIGRLNPNPANARTHSKKQINRLAAIIKQFGFLVPILIEEDHYILAGHARLAAAKLLGMTRVPTISVDDMAARVILGRTAKNTG